jgi:hypothetical protein
VIDDAKLTELAITQQKLISELFELRSQVTELQAALIAIREMIEDRQQH